MVVKEFKQKVTTSINMEQEELDIFNQIAHREGKPVSKIIRQAHMEYIKNHKDGNSTFSLDKWNEDSNFKAIPTLLSRSETWYQYLSECAEKELTDIMIATMRINKQCQNINLTRK